RPGVELPGLRVPGRRFPPVRRLASPGGGRADRRVPPGRGPTGPRPPPAAIPEGGVPGLLERPPFGAGADGRGSHSGGAGGEGGPEAGIPAAGGRSSQSASVPPSPVAGGRRLGGGTGAVAPHRPAGSGVAGHKVAVGLAAAKEPSRQALDGGAPAVV